MALQIGDHAPDFTLFNSDKKKVALADYKGTNLVILFFPLAFTGVCTKELCEMRDSLTDFNHLNAQVVAISVDSLYTLNRFKEEQHLNFPLLSDFNKEVCTAYQSIYAEFGFGMKGVAKRSAFVVDGEGILRYVEVLENAAEIPSFENIKTTLAAIEQ